MKSFTLQNMKMFFCLGLLTTSVSCGQRQTTYSLLPDQNEFKQSVSEVNSKIDILWVIDNSGSMNSSQTNLANNFAAFIQQFASKGYDFQIAVTTTDAYYDAYYSNTNYSQYKKGSASTPGNFRILKGDTPNLATEFIANIKQGVTGSGDERAFQSMKKSLENNGNIGEGFPRADAFLSVIIVSDEDDFSRSAQPNTSTNGSTVYTATQTYIDFLNQYTNTVPGGNKRFSVNAISILDQQCLTQLQDSSQRISTRYNEMVTKTEGIIESICGNFAVSLAKISSSIIELSTIFYLKRKPLVETLKITVDGISVPQNEVNGWVYLSDKNAIQFRGSAVPAQGARIAVDFDPETLTN